MTDLVRDGRGGYIIGSGKEIISPSRTLSSIGGERINEEPIYALIKNSNDQDFS